MGRSFLKSVLSIAGAQGSILFIGAIFTPLLVRLLGPESYGRYATLLSVFAFANFFMSSGTNGAIRKFISERDDVVWQQAVFGRIAFVAAGLALLIFFSFIMAAASGTIQEVFGIDYVILFYLLAIYSVGRQVREFTLRTLMGLKLETYSEPIKVLQKLVFAVLALSAVWFDYGVVGILTADIITSAIIFPITVVILSKHLNLLGVADTNLSSTTRGAIYRYIAGTIFFMLSLMSFYHIDVLILQNFEGERVVGYYKGALVIAENLWMVPVAIEMALLQRISNLWHENKFKQIERLAGRATRFSISITLLIVLGVGALADPLVTLYLGSDFQPAVFPLLLLLPGILCFATIRPILAINQGQRSLRPLIVGTSVCALLNIVLNLLLIPKYGMLGAAVATSTGYSTLVFSQYKVAHWLGYNPFPDIRLQQLLMTGVISAIPIFGLAAVLPPLLSLIIVPLVGFFVYCAAALTTGLIDIKELKPVINYLPIEPNY
ncbi:lipopolysaccharide biosynthesis protein [Haloferax sp. AS1]|uniref:oligosaccharide flippase family protein n=1 Tax=Haloferax sp. AS1 TaxID=2562277 RepID=UPI00165FEE90|nr:polysaccharide biosynthesis C-terminal domain-containing protein [Haloferax sp. AS1]MBC9986800.1 lipopolysaccharide biosynthesis protein [Haloferax sp. AS1]